MPKTKNPKKPKDIQNLTRILQYIAQEAPTKQQLQQKFVKNPKK